LDTRGQGEKNVSALIPVTILTGFLGSGKTTLLGKLIQVSSLSKTLVIINEFGEVGLDKDLLIECEDNTIFQMEDGCVCCSIKDSLVNTLLSACRRFHQSRETKFDSVLIETTGLADPVPIINTLILSPDLKNYFRLSQVITTIDAVNGRETLRRQPESFKQAAVADKLLITKKDIVAKTELEALTGQLKILNPAAPQIFVDTQLNEMKKSLFDSCFTESAKCETVLDWLNVESYQADCTSPAHDPHGTHRGGANSHGDNIKSFCITLEKPIKPGVIDLWIKVLLLFQGSDLLRMKGIVNVADQGGPTVIHAVQHIFHPMVILETWPSSDHRTRIIFITRNLDEASIRRSLMDLLDD
jgi:G3E family GTPase